MGERKLKKEILSLNTLDEAVNCYLNFSNNNLLKKTEMRKTIKTKIGGEFQENCDKILIIK